MDWITHEEDVWFEFRGNSPQQLTPGRYYKGTVDGFAEFGVFVDLSPGVTGLLHRSELDRRLETLDWESGDTVFVQVKNIRDNGNIDLGWSIRQAEREFRGARIHDPNGDADGEKITSTSDDDGPVKTKPKDLSQPARSQNGEDEATDDDETASASASASAEDDESASDSDSASDDESGSARAETQAEARSRSDSADVDVTDESDDDRTDADEGDADADESADRVSVDSLADRVGDVVTIEGTIASARQTGGPTIFEVRDETGTVDCAAFVEAGVRAYPEVDEGDAVRLTGEVERRRGELQVETEDLVVLSDDEADEIEKRLDDALSAKARPDDVTALAAHDPVDAVSDQLLDAAETVRRAVLQSRPIVVRHAATADGYVAGAAVERAVLPLIEDEHARDDAQYHYFVRRPLDEAVYGMDAATNDVTRMLQDRDRHDEKLPLVLLVGTGGTTESLDGLGLLGVYDAERVVVEAADADEEVQEEAEVLVNPGLAGADAHDLSTGALGATLAATVNEDVRDDVAHLPAVSYWEDTPEAYVELADEAGVDAERARELREAVALEAYYQSYEDKRELVTDLLFDGDAAGDGGLAGHVAEQFRIKLDDEVETAQANLETRDVEGVTVAVLDADSFTHRYDFPPTSLLVDELHRRNREGDRYVTVAAAMDELFVRSTADIDVRAAAAAARDAVPEGGVTAVGVRENRIEFLSGARDSVIDAVIDAVVDQF
ncbi:RecJ-like exonuclease, contains DnaJ-type Zn finger domain [Halopelagius inordinatus]|uniref:RecJ-like exonuclease, contains DnaJ-type Zn finger domain n=1 Tax=Halopelagius inordinatus TaxID=553467 RepID=A0A1I2R1T3_9EURY|nr:OB-fold nucleic acid binding domain-containing protein [Halopelagius inordinatus]SFG33459.1 RecJ-like exonuclease, contains DnaJ-type Zn finger domain [Halopelagius inordinatus]